MTSPLCRAVVGGVALQSGTFSEHFNSTESGELCMILYFRKSLLQKKQLAFLRERDTPTCTTTGDITSPVIAMFIRRRWDLFELWLQIICVLSLFYRPNVCNNRNVNAETEKDDKFFAHNSSDGKGRIMNATVYFN